MKQKLPMVNMLLAVFNVWIMGGMFFLVSISYAQQDPQYTQYMYNTMTVNPGYAAEGDALSITALYRAQWVGISGAPKTQTLGIYTPTIQDNIGLGFSVVHDVLGPASETYADGNISYSISFNRSDTKLSFGIKGGAHILNVNWSKGSTKTSDDALFRENINVVSPIVGAGLFLHSQKWYLGLSVPNLLKTKHYSDLEESSAREELSYYLIFGYVFDVFDIIKFKPSTLVKTASAGSVIADISANFLLKEKLTVGVAYRWDSSFSGLAGFQVANGIYVGYAYDATRTNLRRYNNGSHEVVLRFELRKLAKLISPRFF